jgi:hypothetical protein
MSNYLSQSWLIDRRHALRAMGTCISLPLLECMIPLRAAESQPPPRPGAAPSFTWPTVSTRSTIRSPHRARIQVFPVAQAAGEIPRCDHADQRFASSRRPGSRHHDCIKIWLTGGKLGPRTAIPSRWTRRWPKSPAEHTRYPSMEIAINQELTRLDRRRRQRCRRCVAAVRFSRPCSSTKGRQGAAGGTCASRAACSTPTSTRCAGWRENGSGGQGPHGAIPHLGSRGGDPRAAGR